LDNIRYSDYFVARQHAGNDILIVLPIPSIYLSNMPVKCTYGHWSHFLASSSSRGIIHLF